MVESMDLARAGVTGCWAGQLACCLRRYDCDLLTHGVAPVDVTAIMASARDEWWTKAMEVMPAISDGSQSVVRAQPDNVRGGFKLLTYFNWFANGDGDISKRFWCHLTDKLQIQAVAQFRLGSHWLNVECERFSRPFVPRSQRVCKCCSMSSREDEIHLVLQCQLYDDLRSQFMEHFGEFTFSHDDRQADDAIMNMVMNTPRGCADISGFWRSMAVFLVKCKACRSDVLAAGSDN
jgi:hypothetical protein